ncbi:hypothetical protein [Streptomyces sp. DH37]|uniref:hypothetical protein n=1 Tax=Streptomyces sp. DH37 TaxID=3040122 RepID=UPI00244358FA|nr:hypothetical protein [Streptomyces sp. DH37]MDG9701724.1 hypothetical protein [Streptomyces sp. DH37]
MTAPVGRTIADLDVPLEQLIENLRACQTSPHLAEQRHAFLDIDPDLADCWNGAVVHTEGEQQ